MVPEERYAYTLPEEDIAEDQDMEIYHDPLKANMFKERGNHHFKIGDYDEAVNSYSCAVEADRGNPTLYANRAMALLKIAEKHRGEASESDPLPERAREHYRAADWDCCQALRLDKDFVKAYYRRGLARKAMGMASEAIFDFENVLRLEPKNSVAEKELQALRAELATSKPNQKRFFSEYSSIPVEPVDKCDWVGELKRIRIDERNVPDPPKAPPKIKPEAMELDFEVKMPQPARTAFQFYADWRHLERFPEKRLQYLLATGADAVKDIFKDSIEVDIFTDFISILHEALRKDGSLRSQVWSLMEILPSVGRFDTILMFLEPKEIAKVREIISSSESLERLWKGVSNH
ncbi:RNA polymerase II-associated protein 3-like [Galendromus occidentalis]|uniref:RNA polymerase II-associated protein 3 n=1 Tax=Galendromus occidentalis TaxID=34638 RepID=A0AAJ7L6F8_9ACAR|nr:RNA polymerase II-associated protein 3-like [Galendromus occidentalis]